MASSSSLIYLGLAVKLPPDQLFTLERHFLPLGKIGGFPAWLNPMALPSADELACSNCGTPMAFLLQIYCTHPADPPHAFHRVLYLFVCRQGTCSKTNDASNFAVFRCQLPRQNAFYSATEALDPAVVGDQPDPLYAETHTKLCAVCGCRAGKRCAKCARRHYCSREHQIIDWKTCHKDECERVETKDYLQMTRSEKHELKQKHGFTFPEYGIRMESEEASSDGSDSGEDTDEDGSDEEMEVDHEEDEMKKINQFEELSKANGVTAKDCEGLEESKQDMAFRRFSQALDDEPEQVLRYQRGGKPLLATDYSPAPPNQIPECPVCNQPRQFEFQLMPHLLTLIDVDSIGQSVDWATLLVYTCRSNCPIPNDGYAREWLFKQDFVAQPKEDKEER